MKNHEVNLKITRSSEKSLGVVPVNVTFKNSKQ